MSRKQQQKSLIKALDIMDRYGVMPKDVFDVLMLGGAIYRMGDGLTYKEVAQIIDPTGKLWEELTKEHSK